jgi:hypothetical protein
MSRELTNEWPKMVTITRKNRHGHDVQIPLKYPPGHDRHGEFVILENARAEADYDGTGVPADTRPEMHTQQATKYDYWTREEHLKADPDYFHAVFKLGD